MLRIVLLRFFVDVLVAVLGVIGHSSFQFCPG